jgi:hypothetical protein
MRPAIWATILTCCVSGCGSVGGSLEAFCDATAPSVAAHAAALADDGGPRSIRTGALVIRQRDAACGR